MEKYKILCISSICVFGVMHPTTGPEDYLLEPSSSSSSHDIKNNGQIQELLKSFIKRCEIRCRLEEQEHNRLKEQATVFLDQIENQNETIEKLEIDFPFIKGAVNINYSIIYHLLSDISAGDVPKNYNVSDWWNIPLLKKFSAFPEAENLKEMRIELTEIKKDLIQHIDIIKSTKIDDWTNDQIPNIMNILDQTILLCNLIHDVNMKKKFKISKFDSRLEIESLLKLISSLS